MTAPQKAALLWVSRALMATLFVFSGVEKIVKYREVCAFAAAGGLIYVYVFGAEAPASTTPLPRS